VPAPPAPTSMSKKPTPVKPQVVPSMSPATAPPATQVAGFSDARAASKDKGKGQALPGPYVNKVPAGIPSFKEDPYGYNLTYNDDEYTADYATPPMSDTAARVAVILVGTFSAGNSASSSRAGGELAVLHPKNIVEFKLAMEAMKAAHCEGNDRKMDLLASICKVVSLAHKSGKTSPCSKRASPMHGRYQIGYL
jgi:hypothetical protein